MLENGLEIPLVKKATVLYQKKEEIVQKSFFTPILFFSILALLILVVTYKDHKNQQRTKWIDFLLFFVTGLVGVVVFLLWFATDHKATANNFNVFWAFVPNLYIAFTLLKKEFKPWLSNYMILLIALLLLTVVLWVLKIQVFSIGMIPILVLLGVRYVFLYATSKS
jgi:FtsH-binding integral membrane protein